MFPCIQERASYLPVAVSSTVFTMISKTSSSGSFEAGCVIVRQTSNVPISSRTVKSGVSTSIVTMMSAGEE